MSLFYPDFPADYLGWRPGAHVVRTFLGTRPGLRALTARLRGTPVPLPYSPNSLETREMGRRGESNPWADLKVQTTPPEYMTCHDQCSNGANPLRRRFNFSRGNVVTVVCLEPQM
jgi:hypothetical protein